MPKLLDLVQTTKAISLTYECINLIMLGIPPTDTPESQTQFNQTVVQTCSEKLKQLVESEDQNLKYLGLKCMYKLMLLRPAVIAEQKELLYKCLVDQDSGIRHRTLELVCGIVSNVLF